MKNVKGLTGLDSSKLLDCTLSYSCYLCIYEKFLSFLFCLFNWSCFKWEFPLKAIIVCILLNVSLMLLLMLKMCQYLFLIFFIFGCSELHGPGSTGLLVTENGIKSSCVDLQVFKSDVLFKWSTLSLRFLVVDVLQFFSTNFFISCFILLGMFSVSYKYLKYTFHSQLLTVYNIFLLRVNQSVNLTYKYFWWSFVFFVEAGLESVVDVNIYQFV